MWHRLKSLAGAGTQFSLVLYDTLARRGGELAAEETIRRRLVLCGLCPYLDRESNRCKSCGCKIQDSGQRRLLANLANKVAHAASTCPEQTWGAEGDQRMEGIERSRIELRLMEAQAAAKRTEIQIATLPDRKAQLEAEIAKLPQSETQLLDALAQHRAMIDQLEKQLA
jgi:hypothetical protein